MLCPCSLRLQERGGVATQPQTLLLLHLLQRSLLLSLLLNLALLGLENLIARATSVARWETKQTQLLGCCIRRGRHALGRYQILAHTSDGEVACAPSSSKLLADALGVGESGLLKEWLLALK